MFGTKAVNDTTQQVDANYHEAMKKGSKLKTIWKAAKPVLEFAKSIPLIPSKWRDIITVLIVEIDTITVDSPQNAIQQA